MNLGQIRRSLPAPIGQALFAVKYTLDVVGKLQGGAARSCPCCGYRGRFAAYGHPPRYDARCKGCDSLERHRTLTLAMQGPARIEDGGSVLHFAPERVISGLLRRRQIAYLTADIEPGRAERVLNLEAIDLPSESQDVVIANHLLEHVDDAKALSEIRRVLKPGGRLLAMVPICESWAETYENAEVTTPEARRLHFGRYDHVRYYGRDFRDRLKAVGFALAEFVGSGEQVVQYALRRGERVFIATKP